MFSLLDTLELGLFVGKKDNKMQIPICTRSGDVIEPLVKPQWYAAGGGLLTL